MKFIKRKGSDVIWEVYGRDEDNIHIMQYSSSKTSSRTVTNQNFEKYWEQVNSSGEVSK